MKSMHHKDDIIRKAEKKVKDKKDFAMHLGIYFVVMAFLFWINWMFSPSIWWAFFPLFGWGIGIVAHYISVYGLFGIGSTDWEQRELEKEIMILDQDRSRSDSKETLELKQKIELEDEWDEGDFV
ncbi:MAG: 2TM domain-containing protein [Bacteroidia bacterium]|nr:2TM domain-containing protein [Bacteroidia bacterium]